jgi:hypothetical protein
VSDGYVTTFYSFKGGVGRTTLLANVAHVLASADERVLIWDLDLEAPGVHHFPGLEPPERAWQSGFLEWLGDHAAAPPGFTAPVRPDDDVQQARPRAPAGEWPDRDALASLCDRVYQARAPGRVFVLPALGTHADLGRAYGAVDWHALFVEDPARGLHLFRRVCAALCARFEPGFVLIDARTGVSDLGAVLTGFLPDCTVLVGNYGAQSTEGLSAVYLGLDRFAADASASQYRERRLDRVLVASPVPVAPAMRERGRAAWQERFPGVGPRALAEVPMVEGLLFLEDVLVRSAPSSDAARAYRAVAQHLLELRRARARAGLPPLGAGDFQARARRLLTLLGFELKDGEGVTRAIERSVLGERRYLIALGTADTLRGDALAALLDRLRPRREREPTECLLVTDVAPGALRDAVAAAGGVRLFSLAELERQLVDLPAYAAWLRQGWDDSALARAYVAPRRAGASAAGSGDGARDGDDALAHALAWVAGAGPRLLVVVGDDGGGKTSFVRRLAYELALRAATDADAVVPLLVDLRAATPASTLELVVQHLRAAIGWRGSPDALAYLLAAGRIVLLLDGFDEMATASYAAGAAEQLRLVAHLTDQPALAPGGNRVLATCRPAVLARDPALARRLGVGTLELAPFGPGEISQFLANRLGAAKATAAYDAITQTEAIASLAPRPMLLELLADAAVALASGDEPITVAGLFTKHVEAWLAGGGDGGGALTAAQRTALVERLAAELWRLGDVELPPAMLLSVAGERDAVLRGLDADVADRALRTSRFLHRAPVGGYRFVHRQFLEYFLARHLLAAACAGVERLRAALTTERLSPTSAMLFAELAAGTPPAVERAVGTAIAAVASSGQPREAAENAARLLAARDAGASASATAAASAAAAAAAAPRDGKDAP